MNEFMNSCRLLYCVVLVFLWSKDVIISSVTNYSFLNDPHTVPITLASLYEASWIITIRAVVSFATRLLAASCSVWHFANRLGSALYFVPSHVSIPQRETPQVRCTGENEVPARFLLPCSSTGTNQTEVTCSSKNFVAFLPSSVVAFRKTVSGNGFANTSYSYEVINTKYTKILFTRTAETRNTQKYCSRRQLKHETHKNIVHVDSWNTKHTKILFTWTAETRNTQKYCSHGQLKHETHKNVFHIDSWNTKHTKMLLTPTSETPLIPPCRVLKCYFDAVQMK